MLLSYKTNKNINFSPWIDLSSFKTSEIKDTREGEEEDEEEDEEVQTDTKLGNKKFEQKRDLSEAEREEEKRMQEQDVMDNYGDLIRIMFAFMKDVLPCRNRFRSDEAFHFSKIIHEINCTKKHSRGFIYQKYTSGQEMSKIDKMLLKLLRFHASLPFSQGLEPHLIINYEGILKEMILQGHIEKMQFPSHSR